MTLAQGAWLALAAYALHILEEFAFDWRNWARTALHLPVDWPDFYVTNAVVWCRPNLRRHFRWRL